MCQISIDHYPNAVCLESHVKSCVVIDGIRFYIENVEKFTVYMRR